MSANVDRATTVAKGAARKAGDHPVIEWGARLGYAASGVLHLVLAWITAQVALGGASQQASQSGALATVAHQSFGLFLLWVLAVGFAFFALRWIGGGDAKLAAATTLWLGFGLTLPYLVYAALLGGALTLAILALRRMPINPLVTRFRWLERLHDRKSGVPYGIALAIAGMLVYSNSAIFERLAG